MPEKTSDRVRLQQDLVSLVETLDLSELQKQFLRSRWLDQVLWMESAADRSRVAYTSLRLTTIIGGVIVPALVSLNVGGEAAPVVRWLTFALSLLVAISAAVEEFCHFGERWRHYRRAVERLKLEGWQFLQLSGQYRDHKDHAEAYRTFAGLADSLIQQEVEVYITEVVREREVAKDKGQANGA
jgi:hypothetical protein